MTGKRAVFFLSDGTGITAETLGHSLLTQFEQRFEHITLPFIDTTARADEALARIRQANSKNGQRSVVFSTVVDSVLRTRLHTAEAVIFDFFETFIAPLEEELNTQSSHTIGRSHGMLNNSNYDVRIDAMNYALAHDDGVSTHHYDRADVVLVGVSRSGKTPTCIYLALQHGIYAANYPLTEDDVVASGLPEPLRAHRHRLHALTIDAERLSGIRSERRPDSRYASVRQCKYELARAQNLFERVRIPSVDATSMSIEEISTTIIHSRQLPRRLY